MTEPTTPHDEDEVGELIAGQLRSAVDVIAPPGHPLDRREMPCAVVPAPALRTMLDYVDRLRARLGEPPIPRPAEADIPVPVPLDPGSRPAAPVVPFVTEN